MKPTIRQRLLGVVALFACAAAGANERDWLYFPMYQNDTAHAVHYKALRLRPDGLLESAARYPMHSDESEWPKAQWDRAWYEYYTRLIDCDTGLFIDTSHQLLSREGTVLGRRELGRDVWIDRLVATGQTGGGSHRWPSNNEIFLACAGYGDAALKRSRSGKSAPKVPFIGYTRLTTTLGSESDDLLDKAGFVVDVEKLEKASARQPERLFDGLRAQYAAWLAGFTQRPASKGAPAGRPAGDAQAKAVGWLNEQGLYVTSLAVRRDGSIDFTEQVRGLFGVSAPPEAPEATQARVEARLDCRSGVIVASRLLWTDDAGKVLLKQALPWDDVWSEVRQRYGSNGIEGPAVFGIWPGGEEQSAARPAYLICAAAAAQCAGSSPAAESEPLQFSATDFPDTLKTPEAVLLHAHSLWQQRRSQRIPACTF